MKIGILTSVGITYDAFFPPLVERMQEVGHEVVSAASTHSMESSAHRVLRTLTRNPSLINVLAPNEIASWVKAESIDVLITNTATASFLARVRPMPAPVIYFCHGLHWNQESGFLSHIWQRLESVAIKHTDAVVTINDDDDLWFRRKLDPSLVYRLKGGVGVPLEMFPRTQLPPIDSKVRLLWAGEFSKRKRPWLAVELIHLLLKRGVKVELTMCGDGPYLDSTRNKIKELNIQESVILTGHKTGISDLLTASHALLLTSAWEGLPRIGLEAAAVGRPVFALDVKGTRSLPNVLTVPDLNLEMLADLIDQKIQSRFSNISHVDPNQLHPSTAADGLIQMMNRVVRNRKI